MVVPISSFFVETAVLGFDMHPALAMIRFLDPDIVVGEDDHAVVPDAANEEAPVFHAVAIHHDTVSENNHHAVAGQDIGMEVMIPEVIVGDKGEHGGAQAEVNVRGQAAIIPKPDAGFKHGSGWQRRPAAIAVGLPPADPGGSPIITGHPQPTPGVLIPEPINAVISFCETPC